MAELAELNKKRGVCKGRLTVFEKYIAGFADGTTCNEAEALEIQLRCSKMNDVFNEFDQIQSCIEVAAKEGEESEVQQTQRSDFETQFYRTMARAQQLSRSYKTLRRTKPSGHSSPSQSEDEDTDTVKQGATSKSNGGVRLPVIEIPKFAGDYANWLEFRDTFVSLIHSNQSISSIQKFHYLRSSLSGGAYEVIRALEFSADNYTLAWSLLCERYDNTRLLVHNHVKAMFDEEPLKKESASSIRRLLDVYNKNIRSLEVLGEPVKGWDTLLVYIISSKLDVKTNREWEEHKTKFKQVSLNLLLKFLKHRADLLETLDLSNTTTKSQHSSSSIGNQKPLSSKNFKSFAVTQSLQTKKFQCPLCKENHPLYLCKKFIEKSIDEREQFVREAKLCLNCFRTGHNQRMCRLGHCRECNYKHNTLLHKGRVVESPPQNSTTLSVHQQCGQVLLATAMVRISDFNKKCHEVRAVLDSGSQASFMTEALVSKLGLKTQTTNFSVAGINNAVSSVTKKCEANIQSRLNQFQTTITFLVLPCITSSSKQSIDVGTLKIPSNVSLADPEFYNPSNVELLLGADIFWDLLGENRLRLGNKFPVLQETKFGYIVSGPTGKPSSRVNCNISQFDEIQEQLERFWVIEEMPNTKQFISAEESSCEEHFTQNFKRTEDGRFSVAIPLKASETELGDSFERAKQCFLSLERRLQKQSKLKSMYVEFMREYADLGHMTKCDIHNPQSNSYFMPHHGVLREDSTTTKLRAVFNASAPTTTGLSLNDIQMVGPTIQSDLISILLRFRQHRYVMAGDIEKMYRQVLVDESQRHLQQIIWRDDSMKPLEAYRLNTVTYGTASAPFLAVRCLKQLAIECTDQQIRQVINEDFYVDDMLTGHDTDEGLMRIRTLVSRVLASGCFNLRKFRSNLPVCDTHDSSAGSVVVDLSEHEQSKTLGLTWSPSDDMLQFSIKESHEPNITKRVILSTISQVFDPLGLLCFVIIVGKIILQKLWLHKLQWDDPIPKDVLKSWLNFTSCLTYLKDLRVPRFVVCCNPISIQVHVFSDASRDAYGACLYIRSEDANGNIEVHLLCSKGRVAPLKTMTIPRLELSGALAAAKLLLKVTNTTRLSIEKCVLWTDSSIVIGWLKTAPNKLKPFVKNRISEIQELTRAHSWRHVPTSSNPADLLSRGITPKLDSEKFNLWWCGPKFLRTNEENWPNKTFESSDTNLPEVTCNFIVNDPNSELFPFNSFSKLQKIKNTMAYIQRFIHNCRKTKDSNERNLGPLTVAEKRSAFHKLLLLAQKESFPVEYLMLQTGKCLPTKNNLLSLSPFIDENGLLRVGGRIENGAFSFDRKHPVLISCKHILAKLIFESEHVRLMHAGPQLLLNSIREELWPLGGRNLSKQVVHKCQRCFRFNARIVNPIMGNLPKERLQPGYPFQTCGMDYAGPLTALNRRGRGSKTVKVYIALFVCFTTKALHLELVSDLSTNCFLSALRRFISRRSKPHCIFSDNGTQFVGARNELARFLRENSQPISDTLSDEGIDFQFIPPYTPHMAGLAEAGVKSIKSHLKRVLGDCHLVFEDLYTVLVQIEAIVNSRPLTPLTSDPNDLNPLTPGHFLVGRALTALPTPPLVDKNKQRLSHYERLEQMRQHFWARWNKEYVAELQQRTKWQASTGRLDEGALVLVKEDHLPPMKWMLGRVIKVYPGNDGIARVADIRTSRGLIRRAFNKICPLPLDETHGLKDQHQLPFNAGD